MVIAGLLPAQVATFHVRETAGLRRSSYPAHAEFRGQRGATWQLLENGKPIAAQFTAANDGRVEVDFNVSIGPYETRNYSIVEGAAANGEGVGIEETPRSFLVRRAGGLVFDVPRDLAGLLNATGTPRVQYLKPGSTGLRLNVNNSDQPLGAMNARIIKSGPLVCALRFESEESVKARSALEMIFPRSKAWVEIRWTVEERGAAVSTMSAELNLNLEGEPVLADFGAGSYVYTTLRKQQTAALTSDAAAGSQIRGNPVWSIAIDGEAYAAGRSTAEGWAHAMDKMRAVAVAMADFGAAGRRDRIQISADGRLKISREFLSSGPKALTFWLHFVTMPVQVGAVTSPQSMQTPLKVE